MGAVLSHRRFRSLWFAGLISDAGDWLLLIALPIVVFDVTGSAVGTSVAFLIELAPGIVLAPAAGRLVDRLDRRRLLLVITALQALALLPLLAVDGRGGLPVVYAVILAQAVLAALFDPAKNALLPTLVPRRDLVSANSMTGLSQNLGRLVGGPLGGLLLAISGLRAIVLVDAISFLVAGLLIARGGSAARERPAEPVAPAPAQRSGTLALLRRPQIRAVAGVAFVDQIAQGMFVVSFILFVAQRLHGGSGEIGLLRGIQAIGAIAGGLVLSWRGGRASPARLTAWASAAFGVIELVLWNAPRLSTAAPIYWVLFTLVGAPGVLLMTGMISHTQLAAADSERGRAFALLGLVGNAGQVVGILAAGLVTGLLGLSTVLDAQALLYLAGGALAAHLMTDARLPRASIQPGATAAGPPAPISRPGRRPSDRRSQPVARR